MHSSIDGWRTAQGCVGQLQERCAVLDNRAVQALQPLITVTDVRRQLSTYSSSRKQGNTSPQTQSTTYSSLGAAAREANLTAGVTSSNANNADVPEGISPETWADIQNTAKKLDVTGIFDPQTNQLRSKMLQQVKIYKAMQNKHQQAPAVKSTPSGRAEQQASPGEPASKSRNDAACLRSRLEALCQQVMAALPAPLSPNSAAFPATKGSITSSLKQGSCCIKQHLPPQQSNYIAAHPSQANQHQQTPSLHLRPAAQVPPTAPNTGRTVMVDSVGTAGSSTLAAASVAQLSARTSTTAEAVAAWQQQSEAYIQASSTEGCCSYLTGGPRQQRVRQKVVTDHNSSSTRSGTASTGRACSSWQQQQQQQQVTSVIYEESGCDESSRGTSSGPRHRQRPLKKREFTLKECVNIIAAEDRLITPDEEGADAAIQRRMSPAAFEAFQLSVAAAVDTHLQQYRQRALQARQDLLQRELGPNAGQQQQQQGSADLANGNTDAYASANQQGVGTAASDVPTAVAQVSVDAALLTMQQLVTLLAQHDAAPQVLAAAASNDFSDQSPAESSLQQQQQQQPCETATVTKAEAASEKLAAAHTVAELIAAAVEHLAAVTDESQELESALTANPKAAETWHDRQHGGIISSDDSSSSSSTQEVTQSVIIPSPASNAKHHQRPHTCVCTDIMSSTTISIPQLSSTSSVQCCSTTTHGNSASPSISHISAPSTNSSAARSSTLAPPSKTTPAHTAPADSSTANNSSSSSSYPADRVPAGMVLSAPKLQAPTVQEIDALPMPCLPILLDLSCEPAKLLHARLERVWQLLGWPAEEQMDMVLRYTSRAACTQFETALEAWETAAAAVLQRESILQQLAQIRAAMHDLKQQQQQQQLADTGRTGGSPYTHPQLLLGLDASQIHQLLWAFLAATEQVKVADEVLQSVTHQQLKFKGLSYPPAGAVVGASQLQPMLNEVWNLLGCGRM